MDEGSWQRVMEEGQMSSTIFRVNGESYAIGDLVLVRVPIMFASAKINIERWIYRIGMIMKFYPDKSMDIALRHVLDYMDRSYYLLSLTFTDRAGNESVSCKFNRYKSLHPNIKSLLTYGIMFHKREEVRQASSYLAKNKQDG